MGNEWTDPPRNRDSVGNKRKRIKNGGEVFKGQARGSQNSGAHEGEGCALFSLVLLSSGALIIGSAIAAAVELFRSIPG